MNSRTVPLSCFHIIGSQFSGGAERFYLRLVQLLHEQGEQVTAIVRTNSFLHQSLQESEIRTITLPFANGWDMWTRWQIGHLIKKYHPDIVQTYMGRATRLTHTENFPETRHIARLGGYYKIEGYYRHADCWVGNTQGICEYLVQEGLDQDKVHKIGNFVPEATHYSTASLDDFRQQQQLTKNQWVLFALGRFAQKKGFADLLDALALLPEQIHGRGVVLLLAGDGQEAKALRQHAVDLKITHQLRWLGWLKDPGQAFAVADLFICPSRHEPLGNVILEAWRHQKPVLSTATLGAKELITEGLDGVLVECENPPLLAQQIVHLLAGSPQFLQQLANAGINTLNQQHSEQRVLQCYIDLYQQLTAPSRR